MCGIIGAFWRSPPSDSLERVKQALAVMKHRGPDDHGLQQVSPFENASSKLYLGHLRLSILDLSDAGHQPMSSQCGRYSIVYNGEVYNYKELRDELVALGHQFTSGTDTEVLLGAWIQWGQKCLIKLVGMFSFVIYDSRKNILVCSRDAFGIKPLFYSVEPDGSFFFSSELAPLLGLFGERRGANYQRVHDYLVHGLQDDQDSTFVEGVRHLPPAHLMVVDLGSMSTREKAWWKPSIKLTNDISFSAAADKLRELFLESVKLHLRSDVPVGAALSGGIDSSAIVCAMRAVAPDLQIHTFSYVADDPAISEEKWVDLINRHVGAIPHKIRIEDDDVIADLEELVRVQGEPFNSTSMYAQYRIFKEARKHGIPVILEGQGADELLAGYQGYPGQRMRSMLERGQWSELVRFAREWSENLTRGSKSPWRSLVGQLLPESMHSYAQLIGMTPGARALITGGALAKHGVSKATPDMGRRFSGYGRRLMEALSFSLTGHELPSLLRFGDRNAMQFSIENRVPFLTIELADFLLTLPEEYLVSAKGESKHLFRAAMRGVVPDEVLDREDKIGFFTPMERWINMHKAVFSETVSTGPMSKLFGWELFYSEWNESEVAHSINAAMFWRLINLPMWASCNENVSLDPMK